MLEPLVNPLWGREGVLSGQCLDSTYVNGVKIIFTTFGLSFTVVAIRENGNAMAQLQAQEIRPYHHGDLSRALIQAGRRILESGGPAALSLRAVAREAGVSPAAPYHHFKDKCDLLDAVAKEGWMELGAAVAKARAQAPDARAALTNIGVAYVCFARDNPALYRTMYDGACDRATMPDHAKRRPTAAGATSARP